MHRTLLQSLLLTAPIAAAGLLLALIIGIIWGWAGAIAFLVGSSLLLAWVAVAYRVRQLHKSDNTLPTTMHPLYRAIYSTVDPRLNNARNDKEEEHLPPFRFPDKSIRR